MRDYKCMNNFAPCFELMGILISHSVILPKSAPSSLKNFDTNASLLDPILLFHFIEDDPNEVGQQWTRNFE